MTRLILALNHVFRPPEVKGRESARAYSEWEYDWGRDLVRTYLEPAHDLERKKVLDVGCGFGGKTVAYAEAGAAEVYGTDLSEEKAAASARFAAQKNRGRGWGFFAGDASRLPLGDVRFDTVVANDAMEHFAQPEAALREMARVTRPGGAIWLFFTPHFSPLGSHLYDYIYTPWCHLLFGRRALQAAIREILWRRESDPTPEAVERELNEIMDSFDNDLNHMSIRRFHRTVAAVPGLSVSFLELKPAKYRILKVLTKLPLLRELFTGTVICRLTREA